MDTVGIRDLKAQLSRHLKRVRAGHRLLVTERGRTIATIQPVETSPAADWAHALAIALNKQNKGDRNGS